MSEAAKKPPAFVIGAMDSVGSGAVSGWAFDTRDPNRLVRVDLVLDGNYIATVTACRYRHDLRVLGSGDAFHGFHYPLPPQHLDGFNHILEGFVEGTRQHLDHSPLDGVPWNLAARFRRTEIDMRFGPDPLRRPSRRIPQLPRKPKAPVYTPSGRSLPPESLQGVSVVIPTFNRGAQMEQTVLRSLECCENCAVEFIIVDDGSSDDTPERLRRLATLHPQVRYLSIENGGPGRARNFGADLATHQIVLFQGDDVQPAHSEFYRLHLEVHRRMPQLGVSVLGKVVWPDTPDFDVTFAMQHVQGKGQQQFAYYALTPYTFVDWRFHYTANISVKKQVVANWVKSGFNPAFREYGWEDSELAYRLSEVTPGGFGTFYFPAAVAVHFHPYTVRKFIDRQISTGRAAQNFLQVHPNLRKRIGIDVLEKLLTSPPSQKDLHTPRADLLAVIEGLQSWPCVLEAQGTLGQEAWHDDLLTGVFTISYLLGYILANEYPLANYDAAYRYVIEQFQNAVHHASMFEVFGRVPPFSAIAPKVHRAAAD